MTNRRTHLFTYAAAALIALLLPVMASAQDNRSVWERIYDRARDQRDRDYPRDPDYRRNGGYRGGRISDYDRRILRDVARRIKDRSRDLQRDVDRYLDNSRYDGSRREDNINEQVRNFRDAADRFQDRAGDSNDLYRSQSEARQLLDTAARIDRFISRGRVDGRISSRWQQIRSDLRTVADFYGFRMRDLDDGYYGRDDDYRRDRRGYPYPN